MPKIYATSAIPFRAWKRHGILAIVASAATVAVTCFLPGWLPRKPPADPQELRSYLVLGHDEPLEETSVSDSGEEMSLELRAVAFETSALQPLFPDYPSRNEVARGTVREKDLIHFLKAAQGVRTANIALFPKDTNANGFFPFAYGPRPYATGRLTVLRNGRIHLDLELDFGVGMRHFFDMDEPIQEKASFVLEDGQTAFIGGIRRKVRLGEQVNLPLLSELPSLCSWFSVASERETEMEFVFLATPKLVSLR